MCQTKGVCEKYLSSENTGYSLSKYVKIVALLMALILVVAGFCGCKKKTAEQTATDEVSEQAAIDEVSEQAATDEVSEQGSTDEVSEQGATDEVSESAASDEVSEQAATDEAAEQKTEDDGEEEGLEAESDDATSEDFETLDENGQYYSKDDVALYLHLYGHLPSNFMTKKEAKKLGWSGGSLEKYAPGMVIGGDSFGNYEGNLPEDKDYHECDIDTYGKKKRGAKRIVWSDDGYIYYTDDHYESFELLYEGR